MVAAAAAAAVVVVVVAANSVNRFIISTLSYRSIKYPDQIPSGATLSDLG